MPSPQSSEPNINASFPDPDIDYGIITSGSCPTPEDQASFDDQVAGRPPAHE